MVWQAPSSRQGSPAYTLQQPADPKERARFLITNLDLPPGEDMRVQALSHAPPTRWYVDKQRVHADKPCTPEPADFSSQAAYLLEMLGSAEPVAEGASAAGFPGSWHDSAGHAVPIEAAIESRDTLAQRVGQVCVCCCLTSACSASCVGLLSGWETCYSPAAC